MLTNKLFLIALILCVSSSVDSLKLGNMCKINVFQYQDTKVNSFYKIQQQVSLDPNGVISNVNKKK